jgi:PEP-CTERM motif
MNTSLKALLASLAFAAATLASAQTTRITFDAGDPIGGLAAGATLANQYAAYGVTFSPNAFTGAGSSSTGQAWATNTDMTVVSSTGGDVGGLGTPLLVSGNLLRSFAGWLGEDGDPSFRASFSGAISAFSADFAGVSLGSDVRLFAYNGGTLLGTVIGSGMGQFTLSFAAAGITSIVIAPGSFNDWVGVDNITYTVAAVPEPETYALMGLGLAAIGWARRCAAARA